MTLVKTSGPRFQTTDSPDGFRISIPARRTWFMVGFLPVWLALWGFVGVNIIKSLWVSKAGGDWPFLLFWLPAWAAGCVYALGSFLWMLKGREIVTLNLIGSQLMLRREICGRKFRSREFRLEEVRNLRVSVASDSSELRASWFAVIHTVAFDYGARTYRFGYGLDEAELRMVVDTLKQHCTAFK